MRKLRIGVDKVVGKVLINLCHTKLAACVISKIINAPVVAYACAILAIQALVIKWRLHEIFQESMLFVLLKKLN